MNINPPCLALFIGKRVDGTASCSIVKVNSQVPPRAVEYLSMLYSHCIGCKQQLTSHPYYFCDGLPEKDDAAAACSLYPLEGDDVQLDENEKEYRPGDGVNCRCYIEEKLNEQ